MTSRVQLASKLAATTPTCLCLLQFINPVQQLRRLLGCCLLYLLGGHAGCLWLLMHSLTPASHLSSSHCWVGHLGQLCEQLLQELVVVQGHLLGGLGPTHLEGILRLQLLESLQDTPVTVARTVAWMKCQQLPVDSRVCMLAAI